MEVRKTDRADQIHGTAVTSIERNEFADEIVSRAGESDDHLRSMAELLADFIMKTEVTYKIVAGLQETNTEWS